MDALFQQCSRGRSRAITSIEDTVVGEIRHRPSLLSDQLIRTGRFSELVHFTAQKFDAVIETVDDRTFSSRGPEPKYGIKDCMLAYMMLLSGNISLKRSAILADSTFERMLTRGRRALDTLMSKRWSNAPSLSQEFGPKVVASPGFPQERRPYH